MTPQGCHALRVQDVESQKRAALKGHGQKAAFPMETVPAGVLKVCRRLHDAGHRAWLVGGCVRDVLLGKTASDWDIASSAEPKEVMATFRKVIPTGIDHGTVTVLLGGEGYEVTTLRGEGEYTDGRRPDEVFYVKDIEDDLARRDFTVNALAVDVDGRILDPFGGLGDLDSRLIRAVGEAAERFGEDGLRILRGARFVATLEFDLARETEAAFAGALDVYAKVSRERVREEWLKAMKAERPSRAFEVMVRTGILARTFPALAERTNTTPEVWSSALAQLDAVRLRGAARLAPLLAPLGADVASKWLADFRFSRDEMRLVSHLITWSHSPPFEGSDADLRQWLSNARTHLDDCLAMIDALHPIGASAWRARVEASGVREGRLILSVSELPIGGREVIAALGKPGPRVGEILRTLLEEVIADPECGTEEKLQTRVQMLCQGRPTETP